MARQPLYAREGHCRHADNIEENIHPSRTVNRMKNVEQSRRPVLSRLTAVCRHTFKYIYFSPPLPFRMSIETINVHGWLLVDIVGGGIDIT